MEQKIITPAWINVQEIDIVYKSKVKAKDRPTIKSSKDAYNLFLQLWDDNKIDLIEQFKMLLVNRANKVLGAIDISTGGICGTVADPRIIFGSALKSCACAILLAHSHPSGSLKPSQVDKEMTDRLAAAGKLLDIRVLDHLIITREAYYSFADEGFL